MKIPKSSWVLKKEYFNAKLVDNFKPKYLQYMSELGSDLDDIELLNFIERITCLDSVALYEFPGALLKCDCDYFEKVDDNHPIPRCLFELINQ